MTCIVCAVEDNPFTNRASVANCTTEKDFSAGKSPSKSTMSDEKSLILATLLQQVSLLTELSLHSESHSRQSDPLPSLQTEPDISRARHRLNPRSVEHFVDGKLVGCMVGRRVVGDFEGESDGVGVGTKVGSLVGVFDGLRLGVLEGDFEGESDGVGVGAKVGLVVGDFEGKLDGVGVGAKVGSLVGVFDGLRLGVPEGEFVGLVVGDTVG
mmetsp:Transcript_3097/g.5681  ORF Transcript_3097/g.5681 Transcript_3097/m.5681 type:complete len:211 (-) Transcript_3097:134-766(-)